jgi:hypothetical protein
VSPEYQRLFRWSEEQQSRFIESVLLRIPVPQVFTIEREDGKLELVDGLQRVSTIIHFLGHEEVTDEIYRKYFTDSDVLGLTGCEVIADINGLTYDNLPLKNRLEIKRSHVRMVIVKRQSDTFFRYELFKRLNTGGSLLSDQEIRNCSARMIGDAGINFYEFLIACANTDSFKTCTENLFDTIKEQKGDEELVLRFFALKNGLNCFKKSVRDWLNDYMDSVIISRNGNTFDYNAEKKIFDDTFGIISSIFGGDAFLRYKNGLPVGGLAPAYYEAVSMGFCRNIQSIDLLQQESISRKIKEAIIAKIQSDEFRSCTGSGANTQEKLSRRISLMENAVKTHLTQ